MNTKLKAIVNQIRVDAGLDALDKISEEHRLRDDLGLDSFQLAELTVHIEEEFGVDVFADGLVNTIGEIQDKIPTNDK